LAIVRQARRETIYQACAVTTGEIKSQQTGGLNAPGHLQTHGSDAFYKAKPFHANPLAIDAWKTVSLTAPATRETFLLTPRQK
jgi:hypothetical protein